MSQRPASATNGGADTELPASRPGAGFYCALASFLAALWTAMFYLGVIPGRTSGEAMLLLTFLALPLSFVGLGLSLRRWRTTTRRNPATAIGSAIALVVLVSILLVILAVYLSWTRCANSCV